MDTSFLIEQLNRILDELDGISGTSEAYETLEDLNAEFEDALMFLEDEDDPETFKDTLKDISALANDYRGLVDDIPRLEAIANRLELLCR